MIDVAGTSPLWVIQSLQRYPGWYMEAREVSMAFALGSALTSLHSEL